MIKQRMNRVYHEKIFFVKKAKKPFSIYNYIGWPFFGS